MVSNVALLIIGYDPYKDVWDDYFTLLNKYWKDRPKTYLATNSITPAYDGVTAIPCGDSSEWSNKVQVSLDIIQEKYIVLLLEDFFTTRQVDNKRFDELLQLINENDIDYCKLLNQSKIRGRAFKGKKYLHIIDINDKYGISLQPAIWNRDYLKKLVGTDNYNA